MAVVITALLAISVLGTSGIATGALGIALPDRAFAVPTIYNSTTTVSDGSGIANLEPPASPLIIYNSTTIASEHASTVNPDPPGGYNWTGNHLDPTRFPYQFYISLAGAPDGALQAVQNAFNAWNVVIPGHVFAPLIVSNSTKAVSGDGINEIVWAPLPDQLQYAVTKMLINSNHLIVEEDIIFNSNFSWGVTAEGGHLPDYTLDVQNIATHEVGHAIGLNDVNVDYYHNVTMYGSSDFGETQKDSLKPQDIAGAHAIYGS